MSRMERYVCIHGHFYQPPRENPWLEEVELQDGAYPYHDWNARITAECYEPNTVSCILAGDGWIRKIINNYAKISFNFGPTLLSWLERNEPAVYRAVIGADVQSRDNFSGHGSALAQAYNHMIMPLANHRDKVTQIVWGIRDFEYRFGRRPEGMWLPETAVDLETLDIMAEQGIRFTILSPYQARRFRPAGGCEWQEVAAGAIDTTVAYELHLPGSGRTITLFFYDGEISRAVAFERLLSDGERFAKKLLAGFAEEYPYQLVNIATDGETYGHHHRHGDMALAYALDYIEANQLARLTNYAEYLQLHPPTHEVEVYPNSAWSCAHGVERWQSDCGCNSGLHPGWNQAWRAPLRTALDWLRDSIGSRYEDLARHFLKDPWEARDEYIAVILDRSGESCERFLARHAAGEPDADQRITVWKLLELQRHAMLMYTSCGWFFDDISGIETVQVIKYAGRVIQLAGELFATDLEPRFLEMLALAKSNVPRYGDGAQIYGKSVKPAMVDLPKLGAHYAICSLFDAYDEDSRIYCYRVKRLDKEDRLAGAAKMTAGRALVTSEITGEWASLSYGAVYLGSPDANAGVGFYRNEDAYQQMIQDLTGAFERADFAEVIRFLDQHFGGATYSLKQLFRDKQRLVLGQILDAALAEAAGAYRRIYEHRAPLMRFLKDLNIPQPRVLFTAAEIVLNANLRMAFLEDPPDINLINALLGEVDITDVVLDGTILAYVLEQTLKRMGERWLGHPADEAQLAHLDDVVGLARALPFEVDLWKVQNIYYRLMQTVYPGFRNSAGNGDEEARLWLGRFNDLGNKLRVRRNE
ncbi:MAG TPA: DUF3536 domain-containing protein [Spirochaetia bacterium]|nr:DUF3536 domain-containing protein [Spirochaetia bacterium]